MKLVVSLVSSLALFLFMSVASAAEQKSLPVEIEITSLTPKLGHVRVLSFFFDGKTCSVQTDSKTKRTEDVSKCKKIVEGLSGDLKQKDLPSDFINPKTSYWDVKLKTPTGGWQQTVQQERPELCDSAGKCTKPASAPARTIAKKLIQEFTK